MRHVLRQLCALKVSERIASYLYSTSKLIDSLLAMPKHGDAEQLRKQRLKIKEKGLKYAPGHVSLQVLGSGAPGAPRALYLFTDQSRYLFNVGEGSQRLAHEHKMKLSKLEHIFITQPTWDNIGGLPGVALTIQDVGVPVITLHGPKGTEDIFGATRRFVVLKDLEIRMVDCESSVPFDDPVMTVSYVPLTPTSSSIPSENGHPAPVIDRSVEIDDVDYYGHERKRSVGRRPQQQQQQEWVATERIPPTVISYVCKLKPKLGLLKLEACVERGVPPGPLLGQLKNGNDVTLADGTVVKSADVTSPDEPGPVFIVMECPSEDYLPSLTSRTEWADYQADGPADTQAHTVVHFTPSDVAQSEAYTAWVRNFPVTTQHLYLNRDNVCTGSLAVQRTQEQLHAIHPHVFPPLPCVVGVHTPANSNGSSCDIASAATLTSIALRPSGGVDNSQVPVCNPEAYLNEPYNTDEFKEELAKFRHALENNAPASYQEYPKIVFLGTGSCIPNKTRNTSGMLFFTSETTSLLLDCGEATFNQICRLYGTDTKRIMSTLKAVYVSHLHADHHLGLVGVLQGRRRLLGPDAEPVYLLAPHQIMYWLNVYHARFEDILQELTLVSNASLTTTRLDDADDVTIQALLDAVGCREIRTVGVRHCPNAFGVALTLTDGWKLTYSGDTMPSDDLVYLGIDSDVLIHEATMEDELEDEAKYKLHSTTSQALQVGRAMRAKHTILSHFSQRYSKLPRINGPYPDNVGLAFDNMQVSVGDLWSLPLMYPLLKLLFAESIDDMDAKALRREIRKEFKRSASNSPHRPAKLAH